MLELIMNQTAASSSETWLLLYMCVLPNNWAALTANKQYQQKHS